MRISKRVTRGLNCKVFDEYIIIDKYLPDYHNQLALKLKRLIITVSQSLYKLTTNH